MRGIEYISLENIGKFSSLELRLQDGEIVEIQGDNDEGKTTVPAAIASLLTGVVTEKTRERQGETEGVTEGTIAGYHIRRVVKDGKTAYLEVRDSDGEKQGQAQTFLNSIFKGTFLNPFDLAALNAKDRARAVARTINFDVAAVNKSLKEITGRPGKVDRSEDVIIAIEGARKTAYNDRREAKRALDTATSRAQAALDAIPRGYNPDTPPPVAPPAMTALYDQKQDATMRNAERQNLARAITEDEREIARLQEELARLQIRVDGNRQKEAKLGPAEDTSDLDTQIAAHEQAMSEYKAALEQHGERRYRHQQARQYAEERDELRKEWQSLEAQVKALTALPVDLMAKADMPIPGMYISGEDIFLPDEKDNGNLHKLDSFGEGKVLEFCVKVAMALSPAPFVLIDGMEKLGPKRSAELYDYIAGQGYQCIATRTTAGAFRVVGINHEGPDWNLFSDIDVPEVTE